MTNTEKESLRALLVRLGQHIQDKVIRARDASAIEKMSAVAHQAEADTIYEIDRLSEEAILEFFENNWPEDMPVELVAEGLAEGEHTTFPKGLPVMETRYKLLMDPIDGTREFMLVKRSAWILAGIAPQKGEDTSLSDVEVGMMAELPPTKQRLADQISGYRGCGADGLVCERRNLDGGEVRAFQLRPSQARTVEHGAAGLVKFFPEGKAWLSGFEEALWDELVGLGQYDSPVIFDDQYISSGGQLYEILMGHYRFYGDIRPETLSKLGYPDSLVCHPYDIVPAFLLQEAGCVFELPLGGEVNVPLDTTTKVSWIAFANEALAEGIRPVFQRLYRERLDAD